MSKSPEYFVTRSIVPDRSEPPAEIGPAARAAMEEVARLRIQLPQEKLVQALELDEKGSRPRIRG